MSDTLLHESHCLAKCSVTSWNCSQESTASAADTTKPTNLNHLNQRRCRWKPEYFPPSCF